MCQCCTGNRNSSHIDSKQKQLLDKISFMRQESGALIPLLQAAQELYGYLPEEAIKTVAREMKIPVAEVYGVATFYAQFRFNPVGRNIIRVCMGTACHVRGALKVLRSIERELGIKSGETTEDGKFTLETVACIGACGLAPVISINQRVFGNLSPQMVPDILGKFE